MMLGEFGDLVAPMEGARAKPMNKHKWSALSAVLNVVDFERMCVGVASFTVLCAWHRVWTKNPRLPARFTICHALPTLRINREVEVRPNGELQTLPPVGAVACAQPQFWKLQSSCATTGTL